MATETATVEAHGGQSGGHTDRPYINVAIVLAVLTALETATYFIDVFDENFRLLVAFLLPLMVLKFGLVAWYFMHLKQDSRLFGRLFAGGILLAVGVYLVVLLAFDEFF